MESSTFRTGAERSRSIKLTAVIFLIAGLSTSLPAQTDSVTYRKSVCDFYCKYKLNLDSAVNQQLYLKAYEWMGTKYRYAGESRKGIDCSGFVSEVYQRVYGIQLSGGSADIWKTVKPVQKNELKEGDLLFFKIRRGRVSHVGLYLGNNKMVHASVKSGVIISDLGEIYYKKYYFNAGRIP